MTPGAAAVPGAVGMPRQRPTGTVYGGQTGLPTTTNSEAPLEMSGSLTGHILSRGRSSAQQEARRRQERRSRIRGVLFIVLGTLLFFGLLGVVVAILAGDFIMSLVHALTG